jgi:hypothetical protein
MDGENERKYECKRRSENLGVGECKIVCVSTRQFSKIVGE